MAMNKIDRINKEIAKTREKITEYQNKLKGLEAQKTEELRNLLENNKQLNILDIGLFKACVSRIWISHFCTIEVELINGVRIKNITEKVKTSRSENNVHSTQCNDNPCESADS